MPDYAVVLNAFLATLVVAAVAGLLMWSLLTQHRDAGCGDIRLRLARPRLTARRRLGRRQTQRAAQEVVLGR